MIPEFALDFDDPGVRRSPYEQYDEMREIGPVLRNPKMFGALMVHRHADVVRVFRDHERFSSELPAPIIDPNDAFRALVMIGSDPPDHSRLRQVVARAFTPRTIAALEPRLAEITRRLLEPLRSRSAFDVVDALAVPLPVEAIAELLGVPSSDREAFHEWSDRIVLATLDPQQRHLERGRRAADELRQYFADQIADRRRSGGGGGLLATLVQANDDGTMDDAELLASCLLLLIAGNETTTNLITNAALALARHPDARRSVTREPALVPAAIEETLRYDAPIHAAVRRSADGCEIAGVSIAADELLFVCMGAANRDPAEFLDADRFDVDRGAKTHVAFGYGIHFCIGAALARLEARIAIAELLNTAPEYEIATPEPLEYASFNFHRPAQLELAVA